MIVKTQRFGKKKPYERSYLYSVRDGNEIVEVMMDIDELMQRESCGFMYLPDGREAQRAVGEESLRDGMRPQSTKKPRTKARWPLVSVNAGVNPDQAEELREFWEEHQVTGCEVTSDGDVVWNDRKARKRDCEARGLYDRNAGYGDPMPNNK